jgi:hypothetical protein
MTRGSVREPVKSVGEHWCGPTFAEGYGGHPSGET